MAIIKVSVLIAATLAVMWESQSSTMTGFGPYNLDVEYAYLCDSQGTNEANSKLQVYRSPDKTRRVMLHSGSFTWPEGADDARLSGDVYLKGSRGNCNRLVIYEENLCEAAKQAPDIYHQALRLFNVTPSWCPIVPGYYSAKDIEIEITTPMPMFRYGYYKKQWKVSKNGETFACFWLIAEVKEKFASSNGRAGG